MSYEPGWYPQPDGQQRYWDGQSWTEHLAPVATAEAAPFGGPVAGGPDTMDELAEARSAAQRMVYIGLAILVVGIVITVWTYAAAEEGGQFTVVYGAIIIGAIRMGQGLFYLANPARLLRRNETAQKRVEKRAKKKSG
jgi:hypothetical protein